MKSLSSDRATALLVLTVLAMLACLGQPYVNYTPIEWNYSRSKGSAGIGVYMGDKYPSRDYTVVGSGYAALMVGKYTVEQGIEALRSEAATRGCDAIIGVRYVQEEKEIPARGGVAGSGYGFGGGYTGSYKVPCGFVIAKFVVWK
jgi:hypothetical protein